MISRLVENFVFFWSSRILETDAKLRGFFSVQVFPYLVYFLSSFHLHFVFVAFNVLSFHSACLHFLFCLCGAHNCYISSCFCTWVMKYTNCVHISSFVLWMTIKIWHYVNHDYISFLSWESCVEDYIQVFIVYLIIITNEGYDCMMFAFFSLRR